MSYAPQETPSQIFAEKTWLQGAILTSVSYGIVFTLSVSCFFAQLRRLRRSVSKHDVILVVYIIIVFILATLYIAVLADFTQLAFISDRNFPGGPSNFEVAEYNIPIDQLGNFCYAISNWFTDGIVVWRVIVVYSKSGFPKWLVIGFPLLLFIGIFVLSILWMIMISAPAASPWSASDVGKINWTSPYAMMSLITNMLLTLLIALRLLWHRYRLRKALGRDYHSPYISIAAMLIESSMIYGVASLFFLIPFQLNSPLANITFQATPIIQIISPLLIIHRVASGKAWTAETETTMTADTLRTHKSTIRFASNGVRVTVSTEDDGTNTMGGESYKLGPLAYKPEASVVV